MAILGRSLNRLNMIILDILDKKGSLSNKILETHVRLSPYLDEYKWEDQYDHFDILDSLALLEQEGCVVRENYHWRIKR